MENKTIVEGWMLSSDPAATISQAKQDGTLDHLLPEVAACFGYDQNTPYHQLDLGEHLLAVLDQAVTYSYDADFRLAALMHDIGKPQSAWTDPHSGYSHFYHDPRSGLGHDHAAMGAELARGRLNDLEYESASIDRISRLVAHHMWKEFSTINDARRFRAQVGDLAEELLILRLCDRAGKGTPINPRDAKLHEWQELLARV